MKSNTNYKTNEKEEKGDPGSTTNDLPAGGPSSYVLVTLTDLLMFISNVPTSHLLTILKNGSRIQKEKLYPSKV